MEIAPFGARMGFAMGRVAKRGEVLPKLQAESGRIGLTHKPHSNTKYLFRRSSRALPGRAFFKEI
jgi:hypothetical protein